MIVEERQKGKVKKVAGERLISPDSGIRGLPYLGRISAPPPITQALISSETNIILGTKSRNQGLSRQTSRWLKSRSGVPRNKVVR